MITPELHLSMISDISKPMFSHPTPTEPYVSEINHNFLNDVILLNNTRIDSIRSQMKTYYGNIYELYRKVHDCTHSQRNKCSKINNDTTTAVNERYSDRDHALSIAQTNVDREKHFKNDSHYTKSLLKQIDREYFSIIDCKINIGLMVSINNNITGTPSPIGDISDYGSKREYYLILYERTYNRYYGIGGYTNVCMSNYQCSKENYDDYWFIKDYWESQGNKSSRKDISESMKICKRMVRRYKK